MAYAPHSNNEVHRQLLAGQSPTDLPLILGEIRVRETQSRFEYAERRHPDDSFAPEACHILYVLDATAPGGVGTRLARVLKTVAHVVVNEAADGSPVWEKWELAANRAYDTAWVRGAGE